MKSLLTRERLEVLSQLFTNLAAGWLGVVFIIPGITRLENLGDFMWLLKNLFFGILSLLIAIRLSRRKR